MGLPLATVKQIHSADVVTLTDDHDVDVVKDIKADGLVTARRDVALAVLTADCQPVLLADAAAGVVGACHAGWRGAIAGVIEATVAAMRDLGATDIRAVIGPTISQRAYEVSPEFMDEFLATILPMTGSFPAVRMVGRCSTFPRSGCHACARLACTRNGRGTALFGP